MRGFCLVVMLLILTSGVAVAGPNAGVVLSVQGNVDGAATNGSPCTEIALPAACEDLIPSATDDVDGVSWYLVVVVSPPENTPNFNTVVFGLGDYTASNTYIGFYGPCVTGALEISTQDWPNPNQGTAVSWAPNCINGIMEPVYYFGVYAYSAGNIPLAVHPVQGGVVVDCSANPTTDDLEGFGVMGVGGNAGSNPECPGGVQPEPGACCFGPDCVLLLETQCVEQAGDWYGGACNPDGSPCPPDPNPVQETTWGSIKVVYE
ncbi:MAG: hypothetical protein KJ970_07365 [Candidatus Eisenbacteria bacterium]|uniref:Uncharacterized protein n=1 Tax=Eiseniibacteriota bacterium TaxID=2212470 RepID=A0A948RX96_UNCEI|nr:hypothetical protein [Candidatus Eisenbacteria bacterium]MBU1947235.1 hypothetical protein [Candidatus Eisenbacteria bacterium]MBU2690732.1 hypothetical protein [Candidatus Eisenbacteria bacterium]